MVHIKYTYKNGQRYGPYYYENKRVGNKIITTYLGTEHPEVRRRTGGFEWVFAVFGFLFLFGLIFTLALSHNSQLSLSPADQFEISLSKSSYETGEQILGNLNLVLQSGELIPAGSRVLVNLAGESKDISLADLVDSEKIEGEFYLQDSGAFGSGEGYGMLGEKISYPEISFELRIYEGSVSSGGSGETDESPIEEVPVEETPVEEVPVKEEESVGETVNAGEVAETETVVPDQSDSSNVGSDSDTVSEDNGGRSDGSGESSMANSASEGSSESNSGDSSGAPALSPSENIAGVVSFENDFTEEIPEGWEAEIVSGSVFSGEEQLEDSVLDLEFRNGEVIVSTDYSITEEGFGEEFNDGTGNLELNMDLSNFELLALEETHELTFQIVYEGVVLFDSSAEVIVGEGISEVVESTEEETVGTPIEIDEQIVRVGEPVVWTKVVTGKIGEDFAELPLEAEVLSVVKEQASESEDVPIEEQTDSESEVADNIVEVSENVVREVRDVEVGKGVEELMRVETAGDLQLSPSDDVQLFAIDLAAGEVATITYQTPAVEMQTQLEEGKVVLTFTAPEISGHPYPPALASIQLEDKYLDKVNSMRVRWVNENTFVPYNLEGNFVEFEIPHFSTQTFELIFITKAEHLNETRGSVEDVYDFVKEKDNNWTTIPENHYISVTFEQELDNSKDITIYARSNGTARIEVYEKNGTEKIAEFTSVAGEGERKIYLTSLSGLQDSFDLLVLDAEVEFDYVVDPVGNVPRIEFTEDTTEGTINRDSFYVGLNTTDEEYHYSFLDLNKDVVLWMTLEDQETNNALDSSSYSNNGTPEDIIYMLGQYGNASRFGSSSKISVHALDNSALLNDEGMSISLRVKSSYPSRDLISDWGSTTSGGGGKFGPSGLTSSWGWSLYVDSAGRVAFQGGGNGGQAIPVAITSSASITNNQWTHIVLVEDREEGMARIYVNGFVSGSGITRNRAQNAVRDFVIGQQTNDFGFSYHLIDEVIVFNRSLTQEEVRSLNVVYSNPSSNQYYRNFTNMAAGEYSFTGYAVDQYGNRNKTDERTVTLTNYLYCEELNVPNKTYQLNNNLQSNGTCFNITADNVVLEGNNYTINGNLSGYGIMAYGRNNVTVRNLNVKSFEIGVLYEFTNTSVIESILSELNNFSAVEVNTYSTGNRIRNNILRNSIGPGHGLSLFNNSRNNLIEGNTVYGNSAYGIFLGTAPSGNIILNNNIYSNTGAEIQDDSGGGNDRNYLVYNNSYGEIKWINNSFTDGLQVANNIIFPGTINISHNLVYVNDLVVTGRMLGEANVTLYGSPGAGFQEHRILRNNNLCSDCYNFTSLDAPTVRFNVTSWSSYSINGGTPIGGCQTFSTPNVAYLLTQNITNIANDCFIINADNVTLNGLGHTISYLPGQTPDASHDGVSTPQNSNKKGIKVRNLNIVDFGRGVYMDSVSNSEFSNVLVDYSSLLDGSSKFGFRFINLTNSLINDNAESRHATGISLENSYNNTFSRNILLSNSNSFIITGSDNNIVSEGGLINATNIAIRLLQNSHNNSLNSVLVDSANSVNQDILLESGVNGTVLSNMVLKKYSFSNNLITVRNSFGVIKFLGAVNGTGSDLGAHIVIGPNSAVVNSLANTGLNKSALITLYGSPAGAYDGPVIFRDDSQICNASTVPSCYNFTSLMAENVTFNVSSWTKYSIGDISNDLPYALLSSPPNGALYREGIFNISLNANVYDSEDLINATISVAPSLADLNNNVVYKNNSMLSGTAIRKNLTALPISSSSANLISLWRFEGNVLDGSGTNHGTINGNPQFVDGKVGNGIKFDGNDFVNMSSFNVVGSAMTISAWINPASLTGDPRIISKTSGPTEGAHRWMLGIVSGSNQLRARIQTSGVTTTLVSGPAIPAGHWTHVAMTYDNVNVKIYYNGVEVGSSPKSGSVSTSTDPVIIGANINNIALPSYTSYFNGTIDDVGLWNRTLSSGEIKDLYRIKEGSYYWKADVVDARGAVNQSETRIFYVGADYLFNITDPNTADPETVEFGDNITVSFDFLRDGTSLTNNVSVEEIRIGNFITNLVEDEIIFQDDFEDGSFNSVWNPGAGWTICNRNIVNDCETGVPLNAGQRIPQIEGSPSDVSLTLASPLDLSSYSNVRLETGLDMWTTISANNYICLDYSCDGGTNWSRNNFHDGGTLCGGIKDVVIYPAEVCESTNNFTFRFRTRLSGGGNAAAWVDDPVVIMGTKHKNYFPQYSGGKWKVNITTPVALVPGIYNLFVNVTYNTTGISKWETETSAINYSGSLLSGCRNLDIPGVYYVLPNDLTDVSTNCCFNIIADNVTLDGAGRTLDGVGGTTTNSAICAQSVLNVTIKNVTISEFRDAITFTETSGSFIINNNMSSNLGRAVYLNRATRNTIKNNFMDFNQGDDLSFKGIIVLDSGLDNKIEGNYISNSGGPGSDSGPINPAAIFLTSSHRNNITNNLVVSPQGYAILLREESKNNSITNLTAHNMIEGIFLEKGSNNYFEGGLLNNTSLSSSNNRAIFVNSQSDNNTFKNVRIIGTGTQTNDRDLQISQGVNGTVLTDMNISKYSFTGNLLTINNSQFGEIRFLKPITHVGANLAGNVSIGNNFANVTSSSVPAFNVSSQIIIRGLDPGITSPRVLLNGAPCPLSVCSLITISTPGTFVFNVSHWTSYSIQNFSNILPIVNLTGPLNNANITDRTPTFSWNATDPDTVNLTFELRISCHRVGSITSDCTSDNLTISNIEPPSPVDRHTGNHLLQNELNYFIDDNQYYNWSVRARDDFGFGPWSEERRLNVKTLVEINLTRDKVSFTLPPGGNNDTLDNSPLPFQLRNMGNIDVNVTLNASSLWNSPNNNPTNLYQYFVYAFQGGKGIWSPVPNRTVLSEGIVRFNHSASSNFADIHLNITVPSNEPPGLRNSSITFTAWRPA